METTETITVDREGMTASLLVWRRFRRPMPATVERVYELNPGLAESGPFLPVGAVVVMPIPDTGKSTAEATPVRLWG